MQQNAVQCITMQNNTVQCSVVQCSTLLTWRIRGLSSSISYISLRPDVSHENTSVHCAVHCAMQYTLHHGLAIYTDFRFQKPKSGIKLFRLLGYSQAVSPDCSLGKVWVLNTQTVPSMSLKPPSEICSCKPSAASHSGFDPQSPHSLSQS